MTFVEHLQKLRAEMILSVWNSKEFTNEERAKIKKQFAIHAKKYPFSEIILNNLITK